MISRTILVPCEHRVCFTRQAFSPGNPIVRDLIAGQTSSNHRPRVLVLVDEAVAMSNPHLADAILAYGEFHQAAFTLASPPLSLPGGESCKNHWELVERIWQLINEHAIDRHSYVFAIGGGAFLDLVGFASATAHRGIRHIRFPTTTLSQGDGGVGVKNGVNHFGKKNWVGTFSVPHAVVNDFTFLRSLPPREARAGLIEAIKVALIRDKDFFEGLEDRAEALANLEPEAVEYAVQRSAELHVDHIAGGGDPFELGSARPLDFGHWAAHKLEPISNYRVNHGEAVAIGMALDILYSVRIGLLCSQTAERILSLMEAVGFVLFDEDLRACDASGQGLLLRGLEDFREHLGGELTITLVPEIGRKIEVHEIITKEVIGALQDLENRHLGPPKKYPLLARG